MKSLLPFLLAATSLAACSRASAPTAPGAFVSPGGSYVLTGTVSTNTDSGAQPLDGVAIELSKGNLRRQAVTDQDGRFEIDGLSAATWTIALRKSGYTAQAQSVEIAGDTSVDFALAPSDQPPFPTRPEPTKHS